MRPSVPLKRLSAVLILLMFTLPFGSTPLSVAVDGHVAALASVASSEGVRLGPFIDIHTDGVDNLSPAVAYNPVRQEFLVVWFTKQDANTWDIWARRVGVDGGLRGPSFNVHSAASTTMVEPSVAYNPQLDQYLVAYTVLSGTDYSVYARMVNGDGGSAWWVWTSATAAGNTSVAYNAQAQQYLVVYEHDLAPSGAEISGFLVNADGTAGSGATVLASSAGIYRRRPDVVYNPDEGAYLLVYGYEDPSNYPGHIAARVVTPDLTAGPELNLGSLPNSIGDPAIAYGGDEVLVAWNEGDQAQVVARRAASDGSPLGAGCFPLPTTPPAGTRRYADVAYSPFLGYWVVWEATPTSIAESNVIMRHVRHGADLPVGEEIAVDESAGYQGVPGIACTPMGVCLVVEEHNATVPTGDIDIRGRLLSPWRVYVPLALRH